MRRSTEEVQHNWYVKALRAVLITRKESFPRTFAPVERGEDMKIHQEKFRELVLYLSAKSAKDSKFGAKKLNKLLYFCDFLAYVKFGKPITGVEYFRLENGPAPKCLLPVRREMEEEGILRIQRVPLSKERYQERIIPLREPNMRSFSIGEVEHIDSIIEKLWDLDAEDVSELSHKEIGWQVMRDRETIPYGIAFYSNPPLTEAEIERAREIARQRQAA
jgi:uncharacterized phage-associated protein